MLANLPSILVAQVTTCRMYSSSAHCPGISASRRGAGALFSLSSASPSFVPLVCSTMIASDSFSGHPTTRSIALTSTIRVLNSCSPMAAFGDRSPAMVVVFAPNGPEVLSERPNQSSDQYASFLPRVSLSFLDTQWAVSRRTLSCRVCEPQYTTIFWGGRVRCRVQPSSAPALGRHDMTDREWRLIEPLLPRGRPEPRRRDDRQVSGGILWVLRSGAPWRGLPPSYSPYMTCYNRFNRWSKTGIWQRIMEVLQRDDGDDLRGRRRAAVGGNGAGGESDRYLDHACPQARVGCSQGPGATGHRA